MLATWLQDFESLEAISQDHLTRDLFLKMASLTQTGSLQPFLFELQRDEELDAETKGTLTEIAQDPSFLLVVEDYLVRTQIVH
jgi:hypothetical protein